MSGAKPLRRGILQYACEQEKMYLCVESTNQNASCKYVIHACVIRDCCHMCDIIFLCVEKVI